MANLSKLKVMRNHVFIFLGLVMVQFWLGMTINLEISLTAVTYEGISAFVFYALHYWPILAHIIVAIALFLVSLSFVLQSIRSGSKALIVMGLLSLSAIIGAIYNGAMFLLSGQFFGNSIGMAMSAVTAVVIYAVALYFIGYLSAEGEAPRI